MLFVYVRTRATRFLLRKNLCNAGNTYFVLLKLLKIVNINFVLLQNCYYIVGEKCCQFTCMNENGTPVHANAEVELPDEYDDNPASENDNQDDSWAANKWI